MLGLVPGLELGLLELDPDSLDDCLMPDPTAADLGNVDAAVAGDPRPGVPLLQVLRVYFT